MTDIDTFYEKTLGKESALFIGTLWLGMIAKHMDEVRKAEDEARSLAGNFIQKWLDKLYTLYNNVEFKTEIPYNKKNSLPRELEFLSYNTSLQKYQLTKKNIKLSEFFIKWFDSIQLMIDLKNKISETGENQRTIINKERQILLEIGKCQRSFYQEIEKKHLIMPPEKEDMKDVVKKEWLDRPQTKTFGGLND